MINPVAGLETEPVVVRGSNNPFLVEATSSFAELSGNAPVALMDIPFPGLVDPLDAVTNVEDILYQPEPL